MEPVYCDNMVSLYAGDCRDVLLTLPDASVDSIVTDPPYELGFMGKGWDASGIAYDVGMWAECLRVLKPGGHLLAFGGTRTWHRLACAIEDAGFEVRDSIAWMYGSGFPKSLDVSKAIDKAAGAERESATIGATVCKFLASGDECQGHGDSGKSQSGATIHALPTAPSTPDAVRWQGWGTALKPAHEPIVVARKPLTGTVAGNVLEHGVGGLNIDGCRIAARPGDYDHPGDLTKRPMGHSAWAEGSGLKVTQAPPNPGGRWPANVILDEDQADALDQQSGTFKGRVGMKQTSENLTFGVGHERERQTFDHGVTDFGGASRFFYVAKAPTRERPKVDGIAHPTVKPLTLMRWLVRLVTPPGGTVLEPFAGSGTTVEAATAEGFKCIAIEREPDYLPLILSRITRDEDPDGGQLTFDASA